MADSVFSQMARLVTAKHLMCPLQPPIQMESTPEEARKTVLSGKDIVGDLDEMISLVYQEGRIVGWFTWDCFGERMDQCVIPISPESLISADTTAFELARLYAKPAPRPSTLFVVEQTRIQGAIVPTFTAKLPFKLCLFALTMELEEASLQLALRCPDRAWDALPPNRQEQAISVYQRRHQNSADPLRLYPAALLGCTMLVDKGTILRKTKLVPGVSGTTINSVFASVERIRNGCAHTDSSYSDPVLNMNATALWQFIHEVQDLTGSIRAASSISTKDVAAQH